MAVKIPKGGRVSNELILIRGPKLDFATFGIILPRRISKMHKTKVSKVLVHFWKHTMYLISAKQQ